MRIQYCLLAMLLIIASCKNEKTTHEDTTLDVRMTKEPEKLNPVFFPNPTAREVQQYIFLPLAEYDPKTMELYPVMIKAMPMEEEIIDGPYKGGIKYTFEIKEEAKWDDGKDVTGQDYLFTMKAIMHPGTSAGAFRSVISNFSDIQLDSTNAKKITVYYNRYYMLGKEAVLNVEILPKHIYDPAGVLDKYQFKDFLNEKEAEALVAKDSSLIQYAKDCNGVKYTREVVIGNGPYKLVKWDANQQIVLEKKPNYWAKSLKTLATVQQPEKIIFHIIPDETAAVSRLKNGEIDILSGINTASFVDLQKTNPQNIQFKTAQLIKYNSIMINQQNEILKSKKVRQAVAYCSNVDQYISTFEKNNAVRTIGPIHPSKKYYNTAIIPYAFDPEKAKQLLVEDGWSDTNNNGTVDKKINGKTTEMILPIFASGDLGNNIALMLQADCKKAGIGIEITKKEFAQVRKENIETGKYAMCLHSSSADLGLDDLDSKFHSKNAELGESNQAQFKNAKVDELISNINTTRDNALRAKYYLEIQQVMHEELPYIFLYCPKEKFLISDHWQGETNIKRPGYQANNFVSK